MRSCLGLQKNVVVLKPRGSVRKEEEGHVYARHFYRVVFVVLRERRKKNAATGAGPLKGARHRHRGNGEVNWEGNREKGTIKVKNVSLADFLKQLTTLRVMDAK